MERVSRRETSPSCSQAISTVSSALPNPAKCVVNVTTPLCFADMVVHGCWDGEYGISKLPSRISTLMSINPHALIIHAFAQFPLHWSRQLPFFAEGNRDKCTFRVLLLHIVLPASLPRDKGVMLGSKCYSGIEGLWGCVDVCVCSDGRVTNVELFTELEAGVMGRTQLPLCNNMSSHKFQTYHSGVVAEDLAAYKHSGQPGLVNI